jgi:hypothetical protein
MWDESYIFKRTLNVGNAKQDSKYPPIFYLPKNRFFATDLKGKTNEKYKYFQNDFLCGVKTDNKEKPAFHKTQNRGI